MKKTIIFSVILLCITAIAVSVVIIKPSILFELRNQSGVTVKGVASERVISDVAMWSGLVTFSALQSSAKSESAEINVYKKLSDDADLLKKFFESVGAKNASLDFGRIAITPVYRKFENGKISNSIDSYSGSFRVTYTDTDISLVKRISTEITKLMVKGVSISSSAPEYYFTKIEDLKIRLLELASQNARMRAETMLGSSNSKLGSVVSASQGVFQITTPFSTDTSCYGYSDTTSIEKDVRCVVTIDYSIAK